MKNTIKKIEDFLLYYGESWSVYKIKLANKIIRKLIKRYRYSIDCYTVFEIVECIPQERIDTAYRQVANYNEHKEECDVKWTKIIQELKEELKNES